VKVVDESSEGKVIVLYTNDVQSTAFSMDPAGELPGQEAGNAAINRNALPALKP
jgi:hypothetical protein